MMLGLVAAAMVLRTRREMVVERILGDGLDVSEMISNHQCKRISVGDAVTMSRDVICYD